MLEAEKFPASIADLNTCLADVDADHLTHGAEKLPGQADGLEEKLQKDSCAMWRSLADA
jgi:hypothetical protein